ncbi:hypothetical protein ZIOFF_063698 [Zingiber officinale]|uniref:Uncharacterized protein n=1 Tax=Zingiber officinale TaxID=94328 RepID=A0A8J5F6V8_ZINOF|nr:hypothetical protein ZIOFF_063698 [Zingiber officinale]
MDEGGSLDGLWWTFEGYVVGFGTTDELRTEDNYLPLEVRDPFRQDSNVYLTRSKVFHAKLKGSDITFKMQNKAGDMMNLYILRKCSATNRLITGKDHASVQINIGHLDDNGVYTGQYTTFALSGFIRAQVLDQ